MSLMLLSQASLFSDKGLIGTDAGLQVVMSKDGAFAISYNTGALYIYKKSGSGWNRTNTFDGLTNVKSVKISGNLSKIAVSYSSTGSFYADRVQVYNFDTTTSLLTASALVTSTSNIWYFDVNALGVVYVNPGAVLKLFRLLDSTTQTISFTEMAANASVGAWFVNDTTLDFKWAGTSSDTFVASVGTVSVTSTSTFNRVVLATSLPASAADPSDFSKSSFCFVGLGSSSYNFHVVTSAGTQTFTTSSLGLDTNWFTSQARVSENGGLVAILFYNNTNSDHTLFLLSRNSSGNYAVAGNVFYNTPDGKFVNVLSGDSTLRSILVETNLGPKLFTM